MNYREFLAFPSMNCLFYSNLLRCWPYSQWPPRQRKLSTAHQLLQPNCWTGRSLLTFDWSTRVRNQLTCASFFDHVIPSHTRWKNGKIIVTLCNAWLCLTLGNGYSSYWKILLEKKSLVQRKWQDPRIQRVGQFRNIKKWWIMAVF